MHEEKVQEKKVEYIELIYDLIFVYSFRRNNTLMQISHNGFVRPHEFFAYVLVTLAVIQIWNFSTYYINLYGRNDSRNHLFFFINMFLLYFMGVGEKAQWLSYQIRHHLAWGLIITNIAVQYAFEWFRFRNDPVQRKMVLRTMVMMGIEAVLIFATVSIEGIPGILMSIGVILLSIIAEYFIGRESRLTVDFMHLSERAMLLVVLTFGEMIIALTDYFHDEFSLNNIYFALMAFSIVIGLFLSYGLHYDHFLDREKKTDGLKFLLVHVLIIFTLNFISSSLEFMREEEISLMPKIIFLIFSLLAYYGSLFLLEEFVKPTHRFHRTFLIPMAAAGIVFAGLMLLFRNNMRLNIAITVVFVFGVYLMLIRFVRKTEEKG